MRKTIAAILLTVMLPSYCWAQLTLGPSMPTARISGVEKKPYLSDSKFEPDQGRLLIIGQDIQTSIEYLEATTPVIPSGFSAYTSINVPFGLDKPNTQIFDPVTLGFSQQTRKAIQWAQYYPDHYNNTVLQLAVWMDFENILDLTLSGTYDQYIIELGEWIKSINIPVYLRIGYEMDSEYKAWFLENPTLNEKRELAQKFIQAYRKTVNILRNTVQAENIAYVFHSYAQKWSLPEEQWTNRDPLFAGWQGINEWYPGDNYVDWIAISYFEDTENDVIPARDFVAMTSKLHNKALMIAESASIREGAVHNPTIISTWFDPFFQYIEDNNVKCVSYIPVNWDELLQFWNWSWNDTRVQANQNVFSFWNSKINGGDYLFASPDLYNQIGFSQ